MVKSALVTGAARRIGAEIVRRLHAAGYNIVLHYHRSATDAEALANELNAVRANSVRLLQADLLETERLTELVRQTAAFWGGLDVLVNNASGFYPTPFGAITEVQWNDLLGSNLKAPFFLAQSAVPYLRDRKGCIINIGDIYADHPIEKYSVYSLAKAGLATMTRALAKELAPEIRVNGVAPGAILWPEHDADPAKKAEILARIPMKRAGEASDIAKAVLFLVDDAPYVTGQILVVDGGRSLFS
ncbi:pteridine reductase [Methylocaldum gracile subsp. desertum]|uniref:pteridine reductase n=1 Tax=Methylocaldum sp. GT1BW TaxID=3438964 RepID=UPI003DA084F4